MNNHQELVVLGRLIKPHGLKGALKIKCAGIGPEQMIHKESVFLEISGNPVPFFIEWFRPDKQAFGIIKFKGIDTKDEAANYAGQTVLTESQWIHKQNEDIYALDAFVNFEVTDIHHGYLGRITDIIESGPQYLIRLFIDDKEFLIPFNEAIVIEIDEELKLMKTRIPEGLYELYITEED